MAMPVGYIGVIWSHDTMVIDNPIKVTTGIIDSGYRDEIIVELTNTGSESIVINAGEIMAQLLVQHVHHAHLIEAEDLSSSNS
jgi:dUTP pyrophosphatase